MEFFYCPPHDISKEILTFIGEEAYHIVKVLKHKRGDKIIAVDGQGMEYNVRIISSSPTLVQGKIVKKRRKPREPLTKITLAQAIPKGSRMEFCIEKVTEIGVARIIPITTRRSIVIPADESNKVERWRRIAKAAMKQSGRAILPIVEEVQNFKDAVELIPHYDLTLIAWEKEGKRGIKEIINETPRSKILDPHFHTVLLFVGPEGGFTQGEVDLVLDKGALPISLGMRRLRSETAGILFTSLLLHELGDL